MKKLSILAGGCLIALSSVGFSAATTDLSKQWVCTTNASSSDVAADKAADEQMKNTPGAVADAFKFASDHCRDCTEIECEVHD